MVGHSIQARGSDDDVGRRSLAGQHVKEPNNYILFCCPCLDPVQQPDQAHVRSSDLFTIVSHHGAPSSPPRTPAPLLAAATRLVLVPVPVPVPVVPP